MNVSFSTGIPDLDSLLGGVQPGDNLVAYTPDAALYRPFVQALAAWCHREGRRLVYIRIDGSLDALMAELPADNVFDLWDVHERDTSSEGIQSPIHREDRVEELKAYFRKQGKHIHYVVDNFTALRPLLGGEEALRRSFQELCPLLYELETVAYWLVLKGDHPTDTIAAIAHTTQIFLDLSTTTHDSFLWVLKALGRHSEQMMIPHRLILEGDQLRLSALSDADTPHVTLFCEKGADLAQLIDQLTETQGRLENIINSAVDAILTVDPEQRIVLFNPAAEKMFGYTTAEVLGQPLNLLLSERFRQAHVEYFQGLLEAGGVDHLRGDKRDIRVGRHANGEEFPVEITLSQTLVKGQWLATAFVRDVSERIRQEEQLHRLAYFDPLTGLANRTCFEQTLEKALARAHRHEAVAVLFLDLHRFKWINDTQGHLAGDQVLYQVGQRLAEQLRPGDLVARFGGDEFSVLIDPVTDPMYVTNVADRLLDALQLPFTVQDQTFYIGASLGIALYPHTAEDKVTLLKQADLAMFTAKEAGEAYRFHSPVLSQKPDPETELQMGLEKALSSGGFALRYQPILTLAEHRPVALEALARCHIPEFGWVLPSTFIPVAERTGVIHALGEQILEHVLGVGRQWLDQNVAPERIAVNLSPVQLQATDLPHRLERILQKSGWPTERLDLEITEKTLIHDSEAAYRGLYCLRELGIQLTLDDFGTGYSSPEYLKRLPVGRLKIDRSFIRGIDADPTNQAIVSSLIMLASAFGLWVIAEGIETEAEERYLRGIGQGFTSPSGSPIGCHEVQGFLYSEPLAPEYIPQALWGTP